MNSIKASAPGNLFFAGEHAVVYCYPAIVVSIGKRTFVEVTERNDEKVEVESEAYGKAVGRIQEGKVVERGMKNQGLDAILDLCETTAEKFQLKKGFSLKIDSEIPIESGMSSSTAVLCASLKAISAIFGQEIKEDSYFDFLYPLQVKIHGGKASGSEIYSSAGGGYNRLQKVEEGGKTRLDVRPLGKQPFSVVIGNTKVRAPTALTVKIHVPSLIKRNPKMVESTWKGIEKTVNAMEPAIKEGNAEKVGKLMNQNQDLLNKLMLSHPKLDDAINESINAGALGAKLSGGGWGGVMFALVKEEDKEKVAKAIEITGCEAIVTEIGGDGTRIE